MQPIGNLCLANPAWSPLTEPSKDPVFYNAACADTNDGQVCVDAGYYYVQRDAAWQAPCTTVSAVSATAAPAPPRR